MPGMQHESKSLITKVTGQMNSRTKNTWGLILSVAFIAYAMSTHEAVAEKNLHAEKHDM